MYFYELLIIITLLSFRVNANEDNDVEDLIPTFDKTIENITVKIGQQAVLPCFINNLGSNRVIWSKSGDILTLGTSKINSDSRLNIQHRYVSEWHLIIDDVVSDDEGEYKCKTSGNYFKTINLQVQIPPSMDDQLSTPSGTIILKEDAGITLKCYTEGKPEPIVKWYRWKQYKKTVTEKEELSDVGNELFIPAIKRNDPNMYECVARNSVPPATSRVFNIEIQFIPSIQLNTKKIFQFINNRVFLECSIIGNPIEKLYWSKNGVNLNQNYQFKNNYKTDRYDVSNINSPYKTRFTLEIMNLKMQDLGEYQCCAENHFGSLCSTIFVSEIKIENTQKPPVNEPSSLIRKLSVSTEEPITTTPYENDKLNAQDFDLNILYDDEEQQIHTSNPIKLLNEDSNSNNYVIIKSTDLFHAELPLKSSSIFIHHKINTNLIWLTVAILLLIKIVI